MNAIRKNIPNAITLLNLLSGVTAVVLAFHYTTQIGPMPGYMWAFVCIGAAALFDFCDGAAARLLGAYSPLGAELDSLSDLISFGVAPAMLVYNTICLYEWGNASAFTPWALSAAAIVACGALRLARFNVDDSQTTSFVGLPIPAGAIFWIGLVAWTHSTGSYNHWAMSIVVLAVSWLMVSPIRMFSLKFKNFGWRENLRRYVILAAAALFVIADGLSGLMWTIALYLLISILGRKDA